MAKGRARLTGLDWLRLLASLLAGGTAGYLGLLLAMRLLLEPRIVSESALRLSKHVVLVEQVLQIRLPDGLPAGVVIRPDSELSQSQTTVQSRFDRLVHEAMRREFGLERRILRDQPPLQDPWGGHWVRLSSRDPSGHPLWLYQSERLSNSLWYLPLLRILMIAVGGLGGLVLFLRANVEQPLSLMLQRLSEQDLAGPLRLLPEEGIAPIRLLSLRINRLLERINNTATARRQLLHGLTHDLGGPHARLMLRTEILCERLDGGNGEVAKAMAMDLERLRSLTDQLALLGEQELPAERRQACALDDLCGRIVASHPSQLIRLRMPRLLVKLDPDGLERALNNLIDNALEYGAPPVQLSAVRQGSQVLLRVDDHGAGIATDTLLTMPGPSRSNDRQRQRHRGLGLAIVERFCLDHQGRLALLEAPSGGLRAELRLPVLLRAKDQS
ncbi:MULTISPECIES: HAMP domain-containing sensor histidine kinase [unclassified Cyanobium]|uniref:sensor histidine kinase n=1 Tax=unclassified Cyanobium TaxID=2627006 RepID=UPI0020CD2850|nr:MULTISPECIES: HAMP domain-containing sensor histidine kinase [unclassified Cyanobium]MCP9778602.1 HAMP domain-containing histidine kinase [Cyanobium sp. Tous-M-B4]MCP9876234.1 HAMP domain-containing histidine kinase [Cyanobium sp. A2C-AMD]